MAFGVIAAVTTVASAGASYVAGKKAAKSQAAANEAQMKINRLKNNQQKRLWLNQVRQSLADAVIGGSAALAGGYESSRIQGTLSSEGTQRRIGLQEFEELDSLGAEFTSNLNRASRQSFQSQAYGQVSGFAGQLGGYDKISGWLKPKTPD